MANTAKQKGTSYETMVVEYLKAAGFTRSYRPALTGSGDTGDINGIENAMGDDAIVQCKNQKKFNLSGWLDDTVQQAATKSENALPILVVKRPGKGVKQLGESYAVMRLEDVAVLLRLAGYK